MSKNLLNGTNLTNGTVIYEPYSYNVDWRYNSSDNSTMNQIIKTYYDSNGNMISISSSNSPNSIERIIYDEFIPSLTPDMISKKLVPATEERTEGYIMDNCDRYIVQEYGSYIYQMIQEKAYDFASEVVEEAKEDYAISDEDSVIEMIMEEIDFDSLYELVEDILHAPITMEEKLADVGMSISDFI